MEVYQYHKTMRDRLEESMSVLQWKDELLPASEVRLEWSYYVELQIEPAGWQAIWSAPRLICEELNLRYPLRILGTVERVEFRALRAIFVVQAVQEKDVHLPERHEVALEDLFPTKVQENNALNVERTAECLDRLRFFFTHVWMPWDHEYDSDLNWPEKHLESRVRFCYDLRVGNIKRPLATHILMLLNEARFIQQRKEYIELDISDNEDEEGNTSESDELITLMRLHLRMEMIRSEIEMLENPPMRKIFEKIKFADEKFIKNVGYLEMPSEEQKDKKLAYVVILTGMLDQQIELLQTVKEKLPKDQCVRLSSTLQDALNVINAGDSIFVSPGTHAFRTYGYFNDKGRIEGIIDTNSSKQDVPAEESVDKRAFLMSIDGDHTLFVFDGDYFLENLVLDCKNTQMGLVAKNGTLHLKNCRLIGNGISSIQQGIVCSKPAVLILENCTIENFAIGLMFDEGTTITLRNSSIINCHLGMDMKINNTKIEFDKARICGSTKCAIYVDSIDLKQKYEGNFVVLEHLSNLTDYTGESDSWNGTCEFINCQRNIYITNEVQALMANLSLTNTTEEEKQNDEASSNVNDEAVNIVNDKASSNVNDEASKNLNDEATNNINDESSINVNNVKNVVEEN